MPLKHTTETVLTVLLGLMIALTGVVLSVLPPLLVSVWPWTIAFAISVAYPLIVYPFLKSRRADYPFRVLHAFPAAMLLGWLVLELSGSAGAGIGVLQHWYRWGGGLLAVTLGFGLLIFFCLQVIRQRGRRVGLLALLFIPFAVAMAAAEQRDFPARVEGMLAALLYDFDEEEVVEPNLTASEDSDEESWRMKLRRMLRREERLQGRSSEDAQNSMATVISSASQKSTPLIAVKTSSKKRSEPKTTETTSTDTKSPDPKRTEIDAPPRLTKTGGELGMLTMFFLAGYCGVVHQRARKRAI